MNEKPIKKENMMKQIAFLMVALSFAALTHAQEGGIVYRDFDPDLCVAALTYPYPHDTVKVDIDQDGATDFELFMTYRSPYGIIAAYRIAQTWQYRFHYLEADTLVPNDGSDGNNLRWRTSPAPSIITYEGIDGSFTNPQHLMFGLRKNVDDDKYHAWMRMTVSCETNGINAPGYGVFDKVMAYVEDIAYCTIPNYPLRWGQTSLTDGIGEMESTASKLHPNPTTGTVRIEGEKAIEVQVFNALGQLLKTVQNTNEVSLEGLPQGVYMLRITLEGGKVFSDKVVKE